MTTEQTLPPDLIREFVIAGHGNLPKVKEMLAQHPQLLNAAYQWSESDKETALQAAAQVGSATVAEYLLSNGAPLDICTAAMLGRKDRVEHFLAKSSEAVHAKGAHGIPLLPHVAMSGNLELVQTLVRQGAKDGMAFVVHNAVSRRHNEITRWLLENERPDLKWKNYQGKTALAIALERKDEPTARLLREHGATE